MSTEPRRVVVIQNASKDVSTNAIQLVLNQLSLKPGDELKVLAVLDRFSSSSTHSFFRGKQMKHKIKVDPSSLVATDQKTVEEELAKKKEEYHKSPHVMELSEYCETKNIVFHIEVLAGPSPEVASDAAKKLRATWLILDRKMNKYKRHFMDKLPCGIYRIRSHNKIEELRDLELTENTNSLAERPDHVRYTEMLPGSAEEEYSLTRSRSSSSVQLMATGVSSLAKTKTSTYSLAGAQRHLLKCQESQSSSNIKHKTAGQHSLFYISESEEIGQTEVYHIGRPVDYQEQHSSNNEASQVEEEFTNPLCSVCKNKRPKIGQKRDFSYAELHAATQGFSKKNFVSEGGFGSVYKGQLDGMTIAVKQHKSASLQGEKEFKSEVNVLSKARHENVVMLLGSCSEGNHRLLVYEYICNGSLDQHLSEHSRVPLSWEKRIKVAIGSAKGLLYLHENNIIHRDMGPNNILITHDYQPLLGDFGLARSQHQDSTQSTEVVGTLGYLAPEYAEYGKVSTKSDVYSFGVILLQLITGMRTTDKRLEGRSLVGWARPLLRERNYPDLIDERIMNYHDFHQLFWMVRIAEKCLSRDPQKRLNMATVVNALTHVMEGHTCGIITRDCTPVRADSFYSTSDTDESEDDMKESCKSEGELETPSTEPTLTSSMSQIMLRRPAPPSPPMGSTSSSSSSTVKAYYESTLDTEQYEEYQGLRYAKMEK